MGSGNPADQAYGRGVFEVHLKHEFTSEQWKGEQSGRKEKKRWHWLSDLRGNCRAPKSIHGKLKRTWPTHDLPTHLPIFVPTTYQALPTPSSSPYSCEGAGAVKSDFFIPTWVDQVYHLVFSILSPPPLFPVKSDNLLSGNDSDWGVSYQYWHSTFPTRGSHSLMRD